MFEIAMLAIVIAIAWVVIVSVHCFRATKRFWTGFVLSLVIAPIPVVMIVYALDNGFSSRQSTVLVKFLALAIVPCTVAGLIINLERSDKRRMDNTHCKTCGYNLTGNLSGVCPECGNRIGGSA